MGGNQPIFFDENDIKHLDKYFSVPYKHLNILNTGIYRLDSLKTDPQRCFISLTVQYSVGGICSDVLIIC